MTLPDRREWVFALRTFAAAMTALYLALWIDLPRPYWAVATAYITSQIAAGATRSKAIYRLGGTLVGAAATVAMVPSLVNSPVLLTLAIAAWVGLCLFVSLLDRTPASYLPMLAGYTAAIIGFPSVDTPGAIFDVAVARAQEISLGILCASLFSSIVLPQSVLPSIVTRTDAWLAEAQKRGFAALGAARATVEARIARLNLAAEASAIDLLGSSLRYESSGGERAAPATPILRQHMLMIIPSSAAIVDRLDALGRSGALTGRIEGVVEQMRAWILSGRDDAEERRGLRAAVNAIDPPIGPGATWTTLLTASLAARLRDLIDLRHDIRKLRRDLILERKPRQDLAFRYTARARTIRHYDLAVALHSAVSAAIAIVVTSAIWIATAWPAGSTAPMMAALGCCIFASLDDPVPAILAFARFTVVSCVVVAIYLFAVLPATSTFEMLVFALAPYFILCGLLMARPTTMLVGLALAANGASLLALQETYSADFGTFANSSLAMLVGMWTAALTTRLIRSVSAEWTLRRLLRANAEGLRRAARGDGHDHGLELAALMLDRIALAAPRLAKLPPEEVEQLGDLIGEVRVGINVVELRRARRRLVGEARQAVDDLLSRLGRTGMAGADAPMLASLDRAIDALLRESQGDVGRGALMGLTGLRRGLFRDASDFVASPPPSEEVAA